MKPLGSRSYHELLIVFDEENKVKDARYPDNPDKDSWPRDRFKEANLQLGEWGEYELSLAELLNVRLHENQDFGIPEEGMTVVDAIPRKAARDWIAEGKAKDLPEDSHIWLAVCPLIAAPYRA